MRSRRWLVGSVLALAVLAGCGGGDDGGGSGADDTQPTEAGGAPAGGQGKAWAGDDLESLIETEVDGYEATTQSINGTTGTAVYTATDGSGPVTLQAVVTFSPCDPFLCFDLTAEPTDEQLANVRSNLSEVHLDNPDLVFEVGTEELADGYKAFTTYWRSFVDSDTGAATTNSYRATYHDGTNLISVVVSPEAAFGAESEDELREAMDEDDGAAVAKEVFSAFVDEVAAA